MVMYLLIAVPPPPLSTEDDPCGRPRVVGGAMLVAMGPGPGETNNWQEAFEVSSGFVTLTSATTVHVCNSSYSVKYIS